MIGQRDDVGLKKIDGMEYVVTDFFLSYLTDAMVINRSTGLFQLSATEFVIHWDKTNLNLKLHKVL